MNKIREAKEKSALAQTPPPKSNADKLVAEPIVVRKPIGWDIPTKTTVERALRLAEKFVPNMTFEKLKDHPKNGETYAHIIISGENYALLKL